jgi:thiopeptide-type bacteriocin biosynthesis protein
MANAEFHPASFYQLRTPLLSIDEHLAIGASLIQPSEERVGGCYSKPALAGLLRRPEIRDALYLASPDLLDAADRWLADDGREDDDRVGVALFRYLSRMATKPTPFGHLAGCTLGRVGSTTRHELVPRNHYRRCVRLAFGWLHEFAEHLAQCSPANLALRYEVTSTLERSGATHQWVKQTLEGDPPKQVLVRAKLGSPAAALLEDYAAAKTGHEIVAALCRGGLQRSSAQRKFRELVIYQILVPVACPPVTGANPHTHVVTELEQTLPGAPIVGRLRHARRCLQDLEVDHDPGGLSRALIRLTESLPELASPVGRRSFAGIFEADLVKPGFATLEKPVTEQVLSALEVAWRLSPSHEHPDLRIFTERFLERYAEAEVPLLEAIDERRGIGLPWLDDAASSRSPVIGRLTPVPNEEPPHDWGRRDELLFRLLADSLHSGSPTLRISRADLTDGAVPEPPSLPDSFAVAFSLLGGPAAGRGSATVILHSARGPGALSLLGRFAREDDALEAHLRELAAREQAAAGQAVCAEIVHLPEPRLGGIVSRPLLRRYEIPVGGRSGAPPERRIALHDLTLQVVDGNLRLRSRRLGTEILPRLSTAHNFHGRGMGAYRLLSLLQGDAELLHAWSWAPFQSAPFLPRVVYGRTILAPARWLVDALTTQRVASEGHRALDALCDDLHLPDRVGAVEPEGVLDLDLTSPCGRHALLDLARRGRSLVLEESFTVAAAAAVLGPEGGFAHEIVLPFVRTASRPQRARAAQPSAPHQRRCFRPGSEWLYLRVFASVDTADELLNAVIRPLTRELLGRGAVDSWFFLRYPKPDWHLRLRFHGDPQTLLGEVLPECLARLRGPDICAIEVGTYEREVERYGGFVGVKLAERVFRVESDAALDLIALLGATPSRVDERWHCAVAACWALLSANGVPQDRAMSMLAQLRQQTATRFTLRPEQRAHIARRYREVRASLERVIAMMEIPGMSLGGPAGVLRERTRQLDPLLEETARLDASQRLAVPLERVLSAHLHLCLNRLMPKMVRVQEHVIADFLYRLARERAARSASS